MTLYPGMSESEAVAFCDLCNELQIKTVILDSATFEAFWNAVHLWRWPHKCREKALLRTQSFKTRNIKFKRSKFDTTQ